MSIHHHFHEQIFAYLNRTAQIKQEGDGFRDINVIIDYEMQHQAIKYQILLSKFLIFS